MTYKIGYIVGSIAESSINRKLAEAVKGLAPAGVEVEEISIKELPFYDYGNDGNFSEAGLKFKKAIESKDGVIFATPEYNRSIPGVLKNALDTASRPWGQNSFTGKAGAIIGASIGKQGTALAQQHLRTILGFLNINLLGQPEVYLTVDEATFAADGSIADESMRGFLESWWEAFISHLDRVVGH